MIYLILGCYIFFASNNIFPQGYYPLEIGNKWEYRDRYDNSFQYTIQIIGDTVMPNGYKYSVSTYFPGGANGYSRQSGSEVFVYLEDSLLGSGDKLLYNYSKTTGDTVIINYYGEDTSVVTVSYDTILILFGEKRRQWGYYEKYSSGLDQYQEVTDSIGLTYIQFTEANLFNYLSGAIINGRTYGIISGVDYSTKHKNNYCLYQNYPNPFNSTTNIRVYIPTSEKIKITIYDILGCEIVTIFNDETGNGLLNIQWNGKNSEGRDVVSGIYFYTGKLGILNRQAKWCL